jgi:hypothetical protein
MAGPARRLLRNTGALPGAHAAAWLPATELRPIATDFGEALAFNASGEAIVVARDEVTVVQPAFRIWRRPPGGSFVEQVAPEGGDSDIPTTNSAPHLAMNGVGGAVLAWRQTDGLFYSLRDPGGAFGPPQEITVLNMTGLVSLDVELDGAGNVTFAWATVTGSAPNQVSQVRAVQRKPDGTFVSPQTLESAGPGSTTFGSVSLSLNEAGRAVVGWESVGFGPGPSRFAFRDAPLSLFDPFVNPGPGHSGLAAAMGENGAAARAFGSGGRDGRERCGGRPPHRFTDAPRSLPHAPGGARRGVDARRRELAPARRLSGGRARNRALGA